MDNWDDGTQGFLLSVSCSVFSLLLLAYVNILAYVNKNGS
jgi:hypothetical protein